MGDSLTMGMIPIATLANSVRKFQNIYLEEKIG